jgi:hypothetical protein
LVSGCVFVCVWCQREAGEGSGGVGPEEAALCEELQLFRTLHPSGPEQWPAKGPTARVGPCLCSAVGQLGEALGGSTLGPCSQDKAQSRGAEGQAQVLLGIAGTGDALDTLTRLRQEDPGLTCQVRGPHRHRGTGTCTCPCTGILKGAVV